MFKKLRQLDYWIAVPFGILSALGVVMVFSASLTNSAMLNFYKQLVFVIIGWIGAFTLFHLNLNNWRRPQWLKILMYGIIALLVVARIMPAVNGAHGWIPLGFMTLQPAEFLKLILILYCAHILTRVPWQAGVKISRQPLAQLKIWGPPVLSLILLFFMPDNGNMLIAIAIVFVMVLASGVSRKIMVVWFIAISALFALLQPIINLVNKVFHLTGSTHYSILRLINFVNPWADPDQSRQLLYGYYAIAHGGLFGVGLGNSLIKLYLPESNTDFIMAVMTEELGAVVTVIVLMLILILVTRLILLGIRQKNQYQRLILYGVAMLLFVQAFVNLGGVIGVLPITGVVFPFISGGGSSYIAFSAAIGLTLNIAAHQKKAIDIHPNDMVARKDYQ
ncbi:FtsW/RodA/SpoVE family cell cycle protein [Leuconostoc falkenbergense]|uniref:Probable peptidoglycan glycosyltransferase FtsW n=1 Tax=Leuconostoc falkenbergense TaxID=2766470 RepID=A0A9X3E9C6_9LACO|nr:FtsW/RodA/SpoVE family cell cycle protein [Leuconostoc falkenbergense]MCX7579574.1 FtsW/RodA/SpoVE family cell cycle protein [Leuconostoc falkenbergense]